MTTVEREQNTACGIERAVLRMRDSKNRFAHILNFTAICLLAAPPTFASGSTNSAAQAVVHWQNTPYQIRVLVAIEAPGQLRQSLEEQVPRHIHQRVETAIGPMWAVEVQMADSKRRRILFSDSLDVNVDDLANEAAAADKLFVLTIKSNVNGFRLQAREYDTYVQQWGRPHIDDCWQKATIAERAFGLLWRTFAPLVRLELDPQDDELVLLELRGSEIPTKDPNAVWVRRGDVFLPIVRRTTREGDLVEDGVQPVPWTFVTVEDIDAGRIIARVVSGTNHPLGVRRRGRVEQVAIAVHSVPAPTTVHLRSRTDPEKSLIGYEVHAQDVQTESTRLLGYTDDTGRLEIPNGTASVLYLLFKNGDQLLARAPLVPGAVDELEIPLPDDDPRLQAEAAVDALQEDLIDVVARRTILMDRVRRQIQNNRFDDARRLLDELDQLPGRAQFDRDISQQEKLHRTDDDQIQRRIDRLFADTRALLGNYLDARAITRLRDELNAAERATMVQESTDQAASS